MTNLLDENVAHTIANIVTVVFLRSSFSGQIDTAGYLEEKICNAIEPHIVAFWEDVFVEGEKSAWAEQ